MYDKELVSEVLNQNKHSAEAKTVNRFAIIITLMPERH